MKDYPTTPLHDRTVFRELARPLQHPEALCWDPLTRRVYCGGEGGQIYAVTLDGIDGKTGGITVAVGARAASAVGPRTSSSRRP